MAALFLSAASSTLASSCKIFLGTQRLSYPRPSHSSFVEPRISFLKDPATIAALYPGPALLHSAHLETILLLGIEARLKMV